MLKQKINKAFTLIEILVVIIIIIIFVFIAWPNITHWATDREVKKEVYSLVDYIEKKKAEVASGRYAMAWIWISDKPASGKSQAWEMSNEEWAIQMKVPAEARTRPTNGKSILNRGRGCGSSARNYNNEGTQLYTTSSDTFEWSSKVTSSRKHLCIDKESMISTDMEDQNGIPGKTWLIICSTKNTGPDYSKLCYWNRDKLDYRYVIQINTGLKINVYKYNLKKDKWILQ